MKENRFYVYKWFIKETNEVFYIGKGSKDRYKQTIGRNKFFLDMYNSHECASEIIENDLYEDQAFEREMFWIKYYRCNTNFRLTNITDGGEGTSGFHLTEEQKNKISISSKEKWKNDSFRNKMIKIRNKDDSPYKSDDFRKKISSIVSGENNPNYGNKWSNEQKNHLSNVRKEKGIAKGSNNPNSKSIICLETGEIFKTISDALHKYDVKDETSFSIALKERHRTAGKMHWMEYEDHLKDAECRFKELLISYSLSQKPSFICHETKEIIPNKKLLYKQLRTCQNYYDKHYNNGIEKDGKHYFLIKEYLGRFTQ